MSNHRSNKSILLSQKQKSEAVIRRENKNLIRYQTYQQTRLKIIQMVNAELQAKSFIAFCLFICMSFITVTYAGWLT